MSPPDVTMSAPQLPVFFALLISQDAIDAVVCINRIVLHLPTQIIHHTLLLFDCIRILRVRVIKFLKLILSIKHFSHQWPLIFPQFFPVRRKRS